ncbi:MAG: hypothetical protein ACRCYC_14615 [Paraclostridium sp.]|uniref:hypothetical protein n=1 Tax=Paraclostridium sp. TaxID=2023273 RepID=UPI003F3B0F65
MKYNNKKFKVDYFSKYYFYDVEEFKNEKDSEYIINKINECNRLDYKGYTYKYSKFNNIVKGETKKNIDLEIDEISDNILIDGKVNRLDLIYKYEKRQLEDHVRIATKVSNKNEEVSCLIYINNEYSKEFLESLDKIKRNQEKLTENRQQ